MRIVLDGHDSISAWVIFEAKGLQTTNSTSVAAPVDTTVKIRVPQAMMRWVLATAIRRRVTQMEDFRGISEKL